MRVVKCDDPIDVRLLRLREWEARRALSRHKARRPHRQSWLGWFLGQLLRRYERPELVPVRVRADRWA